MSQFSFRGVSHVGFYSFFQTKGFNSSCLVMNNVVLFVARIVSDDLL